MTPGQFRALPEDEQQEMLDYSREVCPSCGNLRSVCSDPMSAWYPQRTTCWATASREVALRKWHAKNEGAKADPHRGYMPNDGVTVWVSEHNLTPDDDFI